VPIEPEAPGWFTTTTFCPSAPSSSPATTRVTWSVEPPADQGTMMVIGLSGFHSAAVAAPASAMPSIVATAVIAILRMISSRLWLWS
jgi:hypothetical protein